MLLNKYSHFTFQYLYKTVPTIHNFTHPQLNAIENLLWYLIVYIRVKTDRMQSNVVKWKAYNSFVLNLGKK